jgi:hypothetical protein
MKNGPALVIRGTIVGCLMVGLLGWILARQVSLLPTTEVAFAASPSEAVVQIAEQSECEVSSGYPEGSCSGAR